jgi:hypothetical protein
LDSCYGGGVGCYERVRDFPELHGCGKICSDD